MEESTTQALSLYLIIGTMGMLFLAGSIIFFVIFYQKRMLQNKMEKQMLETDYQKQLLDSTIDSQEKERKRIASDLHDGVGAMLSAAKLNLNMLKGGTIPANEMIEAVGETKDMIDETIETVRRISKDLLPSSLEKFGLNMAVQELCDKLTNAETRVTFDQSGEYAGLDAQKELMIYRVIQELINNALKHSEAETISIKMQQNDHLQITVEDNGKGFDLEATKNDIKKGVGLYNIENRVSLLDGDVDFVSSPGNGAKVTIVI